MATKASAKKAVPGKKDTGATKAKPKGK